MHLQNYLTMTKKQQKIIDVPSIDDKTMYTAQQFYTNISNIEGYRKEINEQCDELVCQFEDDIVIAQLIHKAILDAVELKDNGQTQWTISDVVPEKRHKIIFELARALANAYADLANKRRVINDVNEALATTRDIIIKHWQSKTSEDKQ